MSVKTTKEKNREMKGKSWRKLEKDRKSIIKKIQSIKITKDYDDKYKE
jgi:hypothetical protein